MQVKQTGIDGLIEILPTLYHDQRGWFYEFFKKTEFEKHGIPSSFVQENQSFSKKGVIRGLHLQTEPYAQAKLVTVLSGKVMDVVVDLRPQSKTFQQVYYCTLESEKRNMLYVPTGFAHGFAALEDSVFHYMCSNLYHKSAEKGIVWNDPTLNINWKTEVPMISEKDMALPSLKEFLEENH